jgi:hypothetical protein
MNANDKLSQLSLLSNSSNIFCTGEKYTVPLYQREYAWNDIQIEQLIDDIVDNTESNYYIGSLIVHKNENNRYEVIDGQQRLTTFFLLFIFLEIHVENSLSFDCRKKSNSTLGAIREKRQNNLRDDDSEQAILSGLEIIREKIIHDKIDINTIKNKLMQVVLYRIEVPDNTDLNRYFEIMNTRGEQLEQHDILKASFMSKISNNKNRDFFAIIWEACSDMTGYIQMHFPDVKMRGKIFGDTWKDVPKSIFVNSDVQVEKMGQMRDKDFINKKLEDILQKDSTSFKIDDGINEKKERVRFDSIVSFPYFLQHVLRVYNQVYNLELDLPEQIDDKKIVKNYELLFKSSKFNKDTPIDFSKCLLKCRFLFDKYIIKREYKPEDFIGSWSLKQLNKSEDATPYYTLTNNIDNENNLMMQSAMRVSYTSPKVMHWITKLLCWLYINTDNPSNYENTTENIIKQAVKNNFLDIENKNMGVETPHIVFNYLDYLLWKEDKQKYVDFVFEFRNSVEHWYPQNPSDGSIKKWESSDLDNFGNLCIIQRNVNSKFSNLSPLSKRSTYSDMVSRGSIKLRMMAENTTDDEAWVLCFDSFGKEMINIIEKAMAK